MSEIHVFSGLGSSIIPRYREGTNKLEKLIDALPGENDAITHIWDEWEMVADAIIKRRGRRFQTAPVILVGHSNGVYAALKIAHKLNRAGIRVAYLASIDRTLKACPDLPENVDFCHDFRAALGRLWGKVRPAPNFTGKFQVVNLPGVSHVDAASHPEVHRTILAKVDQLI